MDDKTAQMAQQLKSNPAMLKALMQSQDGQALMRICRWHLMMRISFIILPHSFIISWTM